MLPPPPLLFSKEKGGFACSPGKHHLYLEMSKVSICFRCPLFSFFFFLIISYIYIYIFIYTQILQYLPY